MENLRNTAMAWRKVLGSDYVLTDQPTRTAAQTATFVTTQTVPAVIRPGNREEVQACVKIANQYKTPIYPISTGKNWGYGSRVPIQDGCVVMDLGRLDKIADYDDKLAYVTVEPGVTQSQLFEYLRERGSHLMMSVTGGPADSSLIGNALERGIGKGPYGDKLAHVCGFEVVLPTGECIHTGFDRFSGAKASKVHRWGVGPYFDGLFTQSNLGIVTKMTVWLYPRPNYLQTFFYTISDDSRLEELVDALRQLKLTGLIKGTFIISNEYRMLSVKQQYPWEETGGETPIPMEIMKKLRKSIGGAVWVGEGALYSVSRKQGRIERKLIKQLLKKRVDKLFFVDAGIAKVLKFIQPILKRITGFDMGRIADMLYDKNLHRGIPTEETIAMAYWKKRFPVPARMDPDLDGCGLIWCVPAVPFDGKQVRNALRIIKETVKSYQFEFNVALNCFTERCLDITTAILYDREVDGEDERARECHNTMLQKLTEEGYIPYRLDIGSMASLPPPEDDYGKLLEKIKRVLDPNDILASGRYDFRKDWPN
ncbi:FAD-binding oxidoreductase [Candidatus Thiosymbion oneisti]|uniref:FAD-binding oxidoreductase n=1 Tax=Candidatus Thiosymbion oneisti TaxID=589554 RepID=UPI000B1C8252|nr:FAD-binding oxidoreductase [Candidatus Thiosymbion oneisti]